MLLIFRAMSYEFKIGGEVETEEDVLKPADCLMMCMKVTKNLIKPMKEIF